MKRFLTLALLCALLPLALIQSARAVEVGGNKILCTHLASQEAREEVGRALTAAGLPGAETFIQRAEEFAALAQDANLAGDWVRPEELSFNLAACMDGWENTNDFSDANCRMTAFTLMGERLQSSLPLEKYKGAYLAFDLDAIETYPRYEDLYAERNRFISFFGEVDASDLAEDKLVAALPGRWAKHGLQAEGENAWLITVAIYDPVDDVVFSGHVGVLIQDSEGLLFVEKLAFEQPYQATRADRLEEIVAMLCARPTYFGEDGEKGPFIYLNDALLLDATGMNPFVE